MHMHTHRVRVSSELGRHAFRRYRPLWAGVSPPRLVDTYSPLRTLVFGLGLGIMPEHERSSRGGVVRELRHVSLVVPWSSDVVHTA